MVASLWQVFLTVVLPVFGIVGLGFASSKKLQVDSRSLTKVAYYVFVPAFVFQKFAKQTIDQSFLLWAFIYAALITLSLAIFSFLLAKLFRRDNNTAAAFVLVATFANSGNFGLPLIKFRFGEEGLFDGTVFFLPLVFMSFLICVGVAGWTSHGGLSGLLRVFKTPAILAVLPAIIFNIYGLPLTLDRITAILGDGMIPVMLFAAGVQLREIGQVRLETDVWMSSSVKLLLAPLMGMAIAFFMPFTENQAKIGIIQSSMPTAVLALIIAAEFKVRPELVTKAVLVTSVAGLPVLTFLLAYL